MVKHQENQAAKRKAFVSLIVVVTLWTSFVGIFSAWNYTKIYDHSYELAEQAARSNFNKDLAYRLWATSHGGVYVKPLLLNVQSRDCFLGKYCCVKPHPVHPSPPPIARAFLTSLAIHLPLNFLLTNYPSGRSS